MRIFVTGGTGFIGSHFLNAAHLAGHDVVALRRGRSEPRIVLVFQPTWVLGEVGSITMEMVKGCDAFVHLAAAGVDARGASWEECFRCNVHDALGAWLAAAAAGVRNFVICGSCFEYGRSGERYDRIPIDAPLEPTGPYHASKAAATMAALGLAVDLGCSVTVLRPFHVFGEGEPATRFWPALRAAAQAGRDFSMSPGEQVRDFVPVAQVAQALLASVVRPPAPGLPLIRNVGTGRPETLLNFAARWWKEWGAKGSLIPGGVAYRANEVMRYVPKI